MLIPGLYVYKVEYLLLYRPYIASIATEPDFRTTIYGIWLN